MPPAPLRESGGGRRAGVLALVGVSGAIALALVIAQVGSKDLPTPSVPSATPAGPSVVAVLPSVKTAPTETPVEVPPRLSRDALAKAVHDGSLEGRLVFVDGILRVTPVPCAGRTGGSTGCVQLEIGGLGLPVSAADSAIPWQGDPPAGAWLVTVARSGTLAYLGSLSPPRAGIPSIDELTSELLGGRLDEPPASLFEATGYLVARSIYPCVTGDAAPTTCPALSRFLAGDAPRTDGSLATARGANVTITASVPEVDRHAAVTEGTFLVTVPGTEPCRPRHVGPACTAAAVSWLLVARYEPSRAVRVQVP